MKSLFIELISASRFPLVQMAACSVSVSRSSDRRPRARSSERPAPRADSVRT